MLNADSQTAGVGKLQGNNLFQYCLNNPIMMTDSSGLWPKWATILIAVVIIAAIVVVCVVQPELIPAIGTAICALASKVANVAQVVVTKVADKLPVIQKTSDKALNVVRNINKGEKIVNITNELKSLTYETGNEQALVKLQNGTRAIISGSEKGINFSTNQITKLFAHTHPFGTGASVPSNADFNALSQLGQKSSYLLVDGEIIKFFPKG